MSRRSVSLNSWFFKTKLKKNHKILHFWEKSSENWKKKHFCDVKYKKTLGARKMTYFKGILVQNRSKIAPEGGENLWGRNFQISRKVKTTVPATPSLGLLGALNHSPHVSTTPTGRRPGRKTLVKTEIVSPRSWRFFFKFPKNLKFINFWKSAPTLMLHRNLIRTCELEQKSEWSLHFSFSRFCERHSRDHPRLAPTESARADPVWPVVENMKNRDTKLTIAFEIFLKSGGGNK